MEHKKPVLSIIICTFNRCDLLKLAIKSCIDQTAAKSLFEIVVIDNNSTDQTKQVCQDFASFGVRYIFETEQGLSAARNTGYKVALADYIGYLDDDAIADQNWVEISLEIIKNEKPDIFGGPIYPFYLSDKPEWFKDEFEIRYAQNESGILAANKYISGSNMIIKKEFLISIKGFPTSLGMNGEKLSYGEDNYVVDLARSQNRYVYYNINLKVKHFVPEWKMNILYFIMFRFEGGRSSFRLSDKQQVGTSLDALGYIKGTIDGLYKESSNIFYDLKKHPEKTDINTRSFEQLLTPFFSLGYYYQAFFSVRKTEENSLIYKILHFNLYKLFKLLRIIK